MNEMVKIDVLLESVLAENGEINWNSAKYLANLVVQLGKDVRSSVQAKDLKEAMWLAQKVASYATDLSQLLKNASAGTPPALAPIPAPAASPVAAERKAIP